VFLQWKRLLTVVLPLAVTIGTGISLFGAAVEGADPTRLVGIGLGAAISVGVQTVFWITLAFAVSERVARNEITNRRWSMDDLPELPSAGRLTLGVALTSFVGSAAVIAAILWLQAARPISINDAQYGLFNPELWSSWLPWFIAVSAAEIAFTLYVYASRRYRWTFAAVNAALSLAFTVPALWLLQAGELFDPRLLTTLQANGLGDAVRTVTAVIGVSVALISGWEIVDGVMRARRASGLPSMVQGTPRAHML
jgi:hypothetical protein